MISGAARMILKAVKALVPSPFLMALIRVWETPDMLSNSSSVMALMAR
mgnify:CR=1 FL=1